MTVSCYCLAPVAAHDTQSLTVLAGQGSRLHRLQSFVHWARGGAVGSAGRAAEGLQ